VFVRKLLERQVLNMSDTPPKRSAVAELKALSNITSIYTEALEEFKFDEVLARKIYAVLCEHQTYAPVGIMTLLSLLIQSICDFGECELPQAKTALLDFITMFDVVAQEKEI
jgi:hypothetical protein